MNNNFILKTDAYKLTHWKQYPKGTQTVYSYLESRGGKFPATVFFGLQYILKHHMVGQVVTKEMVDYAAEFANNVFGTNQLFNREGWDYIVGKHGGKLPLYISAVPEGTLVPVSNALMTVFNTDDQLDKTGFLTNATESLMLQVWYPTTVATLSFYIRRIVKKYADLCGGSVSPFHLNDFGYRGVSSDESAAIGGAAHLTSFLGTDNLRGIQLLQEYYGGGWGHSVFASEHSTTTIYGEKGELEAFTRFLDELPDEALGSFVIDSYNPDNAVGYILGTLLRDRILARKGKIVVRPDSGDPVEMSVRMLNLLWEKFGGTTNDKGFKVLVPQVGVIYGDGINYDSIEEILQAVVGAGFSTDNIVFGCGGKLLQAMDRDTQKFAFKCSSAKVNGQWRDVFKKPSADPSKNSKRGQLSLIKENGAFRTVGEQYQIAWGGENYLKPVFQDGKLLFDSNYSEIRNRINAQV